MSTRMSRTKGVEPGLLRRVAFVDALRAASDGAKARPLAEVVKGHLVQLWEHDGRAGATGPGRRPERIHVRPHFITRPPSDTLGPVLPRLIKSRGLQLRLELLMLFDAQCRHAPGSSVRNVRRVAPRADQEYASWRELVLAPTTPTPGTDRGAGDLRARQITEAMRTLEEQDLVAIPYQPGGSRRRYSDVRLLSEESTPEEHMSYVVPQGGVHIPRQFFTNLWVFALTDTELATYLALSYLRSRFPSRHFTDGVFLRAADRNDIFRLTRTTWRSTNLLHRFRLIDRVPDPHRNFQTGNVGNIGKRWANREVAPVRFMLSDEALHRPALTTIRQVLTAPTQEDQERLTGRPTLGFIGPPGESPQT